MRGGFDSGSWLRPVFDAQMIDTPEFAGVVRHEREVVDHAVAASSRSNGPMTCPLDSKS